MKKEKLLKLADEINVAALPIPRMLFGEYTQDYNQCSDIYDGLITFRTKSILKVCEVNWNSILDYDHPLYAIKEEDGYTLLLDRTYGTKLTYEQTVLAIKLYLATETCYINEVIKITEK